MDYNRRQFLYFGAMAIGNLNGLSQFASANQISQGNKVQRAPREIQILNLLEYYRKQDNPVRNGMTEIDKSFSSKGHSYGIKIGIPKSILGRMPELREDFGIGSMVDSMYLFSDEYFLELPRGEEITSIIRFDKSYDQKNGFAGANMEMSMPVAQSASKKNPNSRPNLQNVVKEFELQTLIAINECLEGEATNETTANYIIAKRNLEQVLSHRTS